MIKVYVNEDPYDIANNFCKTYGLKKEVIERLAKTILNFRNLYLQKNNINNRDIKAQNILVFENNIFIISYFVEAKQFKKKNDIMSTL